MEYMDKVRAIEVDLVSSNYEMEDPGVQKEIEVVAI